MMLQEVINLRFYEVRRLKIKLWLFIFHASQSFILLAQEHSSGSIAPMYYIKGGLLAIAHSVTVGHACHYACGYYQNSCHIPPFIIRPLVFSPLGFPGCYNWGGHPEPYLFINNSLCLMLVGGLILNLVKCMLLPYAAALPIAILTAALFVLPTMLLFVAMRVAAMLTFESIPSRSVISVLTGVYLSVPAAIDTLK